MTAIRDGRFAPSPTGPLHLGSLRTALLAWLFARSAASRFIVRVEDLDAARVVPGAERTQLDDLHALGLDWDGTVLRQSERLERYDAALARLQADGLLYPCYCTRAEIRQAASAPHPIGPERPYPGTCRKLTSAQRAARARAGRVPALRLRAPRRVVRFQDRVAGECYGRLDDFVVCRNDRVPAYHLAVVVDDAAQGIGEVVRGDDLLSSTPRQIALAGALGLPVPSYAHVPLVLGADGRRLAKRNGAITLAEQLAAGACAADVLALLAHSLGLAAAGERPGLDVLLARFDPARIPHEPWRLPAAQADPQAPVASSAITREI